MAQQSWNEQAKRHALARGLSNILKDNLVYMDDPDHFNQDVALLHHVDNKVTAQLAEQSSP